MKVCVLGLRGIPGVAGGIETHCEQLYPRLARLRRQDDIIIVGRQAYIGNDARKLDTNLSVQPLPAARHSYFETITNTILGVFAARFRFGADLVHIHAIGPGLLLPLARLFGLKTVLTHHGEDYARSKWNGAAKRVLRIGEYMGVRFADAVIAVSPSVSARLKADFPARAERISYVPNGADHFGEQAALDETVLSRFGLEPDAYVVSVGRLVPEKGFHELIEAHRLSGIELPLVIVGSDAGSAYEARIRASADANVVFTGAQPHAAVAALLKHARLFVLASHHEGLPIAALEAMAMDAPLLVSDITPNRNLELPDANYFHVGDINDLSDKLIACIELRPRVKLQKQFRWDSIASRTSEIYDELK